MLTSGSLTPLMDDTKSLLLEFNKSHHILYPHTTIILNYISPWILQKYEWLSEECSHFMLLSSLILKATIFLFSLSDFKIQASAMSNQDPQWLRTKT